VAWVLSHNDALLIEQTTQKLTDPETQKCLLE
jgi:hypothetical protein